MPRMSPFQLFLIAAAIAALGGLAWPHTWAEVFAPSFLMPALVSVATVVAGILSKAPQPPQEK